MTDRDLLIALQKQVDELKAKIAGLEASVTEREELFETLQASHIGNNELFRAENPGQPQGDAGRDYFDKI